MNVGHIKSDKRFFEGRNIGERRIANGSFERSSRSNLNNCCTFGGYVGDCCAGSCQFSLIGIGSQRG